VAELRPGARQRPTHAIIAESLASIEGLLARLELGLHVSDQQRATIRKLYVQTRRERDVLAVALRLEELE
jgi:hypothetical protein